MNRHDLLAALALGLLNLLMFISVEKVWGTTPGFVGVAELKLTYYVPFIFGILIGALIAALLAKEFSVRVPDARTAAQTFVGGLLMGIGLAMAPGCNIGYLVSGLPGLGVAPLLGSIGMLLGAFASFKLIKVFAKR